MEQPSYLTEIAGQAATGSEDLNAEPRAAFIALLEEIKKRTAAIDADTVADPRWPNHTPAWWLAMRRLQDECYRCAAIAGATRALEAAK